MKDWSFLYDNETGQYVGVECPVCKEKFAADYPPEECPCCGFEYNN